MAKEMSDAELTIKGAVISGIQKSKGEPMEIAVSNIINSVFSKETVWAICEVLQTNQTRTDDNCFACGHKITERKESLSKGLCNTLLKFYRATVNADNKTLHIRKHTVNGVRYFETAETTNFQKAQYFGLARPALLKGRWQLTESGIDFVNNRKAIPKYVFVKNNQIVGESKEKVRISEITDIPYWLERENYG